MAPSTPALALILPSLPITISWKAPRVPEPSSRVNRLIAASAPPTSFQFLISPAKIFFTWSMVSVSTLLDKCTMITTPSLAIVVSFTVALSSGVSSREAAPISAVPSWTALMPAPVPPPATLTLMFGFFSMKAVTSSSDRGCTEVDPAILTVPDKSAALTMTCLRAPSQCTCAPSDSPTKRSGTIVRPPTIRAGTSSFAADAPIVAVVEPIARITLVLPLTPVTVRVLAFQLTVAPSASKIARIGTSARSF